MLVAINARTLLTHYAHFFRVENARVGADAIVILGPPRFPRVRHALELTSKGFADNILLPELPSLPWEFVYLNPDDVRFVQAVAQRMDIDVPVQLVRNYDHGVLSTYDEAWDLRRYSLEHNLERFIIVTDAFHTRRALYAFEKVFEGTAVEIEVSAVPHEFQHEWNESSWWTAEKGLQVYITEPFKFVFYLFADRNLSIVTND